MRRQDQLVIALAVLALILCLAHLAHGSPKRRLFCPCRAANCSMPCIDCCGPRGMLDCDADVPSCHHK